MPLLVTDAVALVERHQEQVPTALVQIVTRQIRFASYPLDEIIAIGPETGAIVVHAIALSGRIGAETLKHLRGELGRPGADGRSDRVVDRPVDYLDTIEVLAALVVRHIDDRHPAA